MALEPESLYRQLIQLASEVPGDLLGTNQAISAETHRWLGRAAILIEEVAGKDLSARYDVIAFTSAADGLMGILRENHAHQIVSILNRALARAEMRAPASAQGAFIAVGAGFDALQVIGKVLKAAAKEVLVVDAYMDAKVVTDFLPLVPEGVSIRLLTDPSATKADLVAPAVARWTGQFGAARPLEARFSGPRALHDRLIVIDGARGWALSQSLKDFAGRSPASVLRYPDDVATLKIDHYGREWASGTAI